LVDSVSVSVTGTPDAVSPTVSITLPTNGTVVSGTRTISVSAEDSGSGVKEVRFYIDNSLTPLCTDANPSYLCDWDTSSVSSNQSHSITATAEDLAGNTASAVINVTVNNGSLPTEPVLSGVNNDYSFDQATNTFILNSGQVYFFKNSLSVVNGLANTEYFLKIPSNTTLFPCFGISGCSLEDTLVIDQTISKTFLEGIINLRGKGKNALNLSVVKDLDSKNGVIISSGANGTDNGAGLEINAGLSGQILLQGKTTVLVNSTLTLTSSGANGGNSTSGIGGNAADGEYMNVSNLIFLANSSVSVNSNGGNGGSGTSSGYAGSGKNIMLDNISHETNTVVSFNLLKGTGTDSSKRNGNIGIKGCDLIGLAVSSCQAGEILVSSNDRIDFINSLSNCGDAIINDSGENSACLGETNAIFSLTGRVNDFQGNDLSGSLSELSLTDANSGTNIKSFPSVNFVGGLFNFSFSDVLLTFPFNYFLNFKLHTSTPSVFDVILQEQLNLVLGQEDKNMTIPFEGKVKIDSGFIKNIKITDSDGTIKLNDATPRPFSAGHFSTEISVALKQNTLYSITFDVCNLTSCPYTNNKFDFFTWKELG
jgi:hypothetical protein